MAASTSRVAVPDDPLLRGARHDYADAFEVRLDVVHLRTEGPLLRAEIVARRTAPTVAGFATYLFYKTPVTPLLWRAIGPLHRTIAPYLLRRAASSLAEAGEPDAG